MKNSIIIFFTAFITFFACKNNQVQNEGNTQTSISSKPDMETIYACPMHPEIKGKKGDKCSKCGMSLTEVKNTTTETKTNNQSEAGAAVQPGSTVSIKEIVNGYLLLKNALVADNTKDAASAGKTLESAFKSFDKNALNAEQKKAYEEIEEDAREHAEHIGDNGGKIEHQREHFDMLSKDIYDLVKVFGSEQTLYQDFCKKYNKGKGASWLSETKEINNPYLGKKISACCVMKGEIK
jgi:hypothetical protein